MKPSDIKHIRGQLGLTQRQFAERLGCASWETVSYWENGHTKPMRVFDRALERLRAESERRGRAR